MKPRSSTSKDPHDVPRGAPGEFTPAPLDIDGKSGAVDPAVPVDPVDPPDPTDPIDADKAP